MARSVFIAILRSYLSASINVVDFTFTFILGPGPLKIRRRIGDPLPLPLPLLATTTTTTPRSLKAYRTKYMEHSRPSGGGVT